MQLTDKAAKLRNDNRVLTIENWEIVSGKPDKNQLYAQIVTRNILNTPIEVFDNLILVYNGVIDGVWYPVRLELDL